MKAAAIAETGRGDLLSIYLRAEMAKPFSWDSFGTGDCLMFLAGWWQMLNGEDPAAALRGAYHDEASARAALTKEGGAIAFLDRVAAERCEPLQARRGDIGLLSFKGWHLGLICTGPMWALRNGTGGVGFTRMPADIAWRSSRQGNTRRDRNEDHGLHDGRKARS